MISPQELKSVIEDCHSYKLMHRNDDPQHKTNRVAEAIIMLADECDKLRCCIYDAMQVADTDTHSILAESGINGSGECPVCDRKKT